MSHLEEFLAFVLPWDGEDKDTWKSVWENTGIIGHDGKPIFAGYADNTLPGLAQKIRFIDRRGHDTYIGTGSQSEALPPKEGRKWWRSLRRGYNIFSQQCLFADIDVNVDGNKPNAYADQSEAVQALIQFCKDIGFPEWSLMLDSGSGGLHAYWRFERAVRAAEWQPMANAFATLLGKGIKCDAGVTKDVARILRPPETHNHKHKDKGRIGLVRMGQPGKSYKVEDIKAALKVPHLYVAATTAKPRAGTGVNAALAAMPTMVPAIGMDVVADAGCFVFEEALSTGGRDHEYPLWFLLLCAARFDINPHEAAHELSEKHPNYSFTETQQKIESLEHERTLRDIGWPHCREFDRVSPLCQQCPHLKENKTPFHLVWPPPQPNTAPAPTPGLPSQFAYDKNGYLQGYSIISKAQVFTTILRYHVYDGALDEEDNLVFKADVGKVPRFIVVPQGVMLSQRDCMRSFSEQGLMVDKDHFEAVRRFVVAFTETLQQAKTRIRSQGFGWTDDMGFCYAEKIVRPTGEEPAYQRGRQNLSPYLPKGDLDVWKKAAKYITDQHRPELEILLATAFAAPLLKMTLSQAVLLSVYSRESGIGKSTALKIAQAVWGHPVTGVNGLDDTENAIIAKVGDLRHLPLYWDEMKTKNQYDRVINVTFQLGQGKNKARLDRDSKAREVKSFATMMTACSNDSLFNLVTHNTKGTRAGAYRVFEIVVPPAVGKSRWSITEVSGVLASLEENYGRAGEVYAKFLGQKSADVKTKITALQHSLEEHLRTTPDERFWLATIAALIVGAGEAATLGLADFHVKEMMQVLAGTLFKLRDRMSVEVQEMNTALDGEEFLDRLITDLFGKQLVVTTRIHSGTKPKNDIKLATGDASRLQGVWAQIGMAENVLRVKAGEFRDYIRETGHNYTEVRFILQNHFNMRDVKAGVGVGVSIFGGVFDKTQTRCYDIDLPAGLSIPSSPSASSGSP
jgi:hypothetical protein